MYFKQFTWLYTINIAAITNSLNSKCDNYKLYYFSDGQFATRTL